MPVDFLSSQVKPQSPLLFLGPVLPVLTWSDAKQYPNWGGGSVMQEFPLRTWKEKSDGRMQGGLFFFALFCHLNNCKWLLHLMSLFLFFRGHFLPSWSQLLHGDADIQFCKCVCLLQHVKKTNIKTNHLSASRASRTNGAFPLLPFTSTVLPYWVSIL